MPQRQVPWTILRMSSNPSGAADGVQQCGRKLCLLFEEQLVQGLPSQEATRGDQLAQRVDRSARRGDRRALLTVWSMTFS
jgi:hypothetical protein